jgi:DNA polymerase elongation subunit (family B)
MLKVKETFQKYRQRLQKGRVPLVDLIFTKMLSKDTNAYTANNTAETGAIYQLQDEGKTMQEGKNRPTCKEIARGTRANCYYYHHPSAFAIEFQK